MKSLQLLLLFLQILQVMILWFHDWIPTGGINGRRLNDVAAVRGQQSLRSLVIVTLIQSLPYTLGLYFSAPFIAQPYPGWVRQWLLISYSILFIGELHAWWVPYLLWPDEPRAARYRLMFGNTHAFLPQRNGMAPNTLHTVLHAATLGTLLLLPIQ